ncbi:CAMKK protein kinase [Saprolegnia diclina VS20]|uniref:CAMKK protein kinase n=1 Tax=Saprolegnia diclina (strain VS20) TaxID=1156394 RepID=T0QWX5_SAPDV|nr:CAMKK protein kinase [Saprolegnia diclina VS20]EQC38510.1 CAMKK protein kinase [Saprolegnia diclina VS20]|eukprot:XP_008608102.1 CAMKK protein kinase [Saprolegnia diclina VS20]
MAAPWQSQLTTTETSPTPDVVNEYHVKDLLGRGAFAKVKLCERVVDGAPPRPFALKILSKPALAKMKEYIRDGTSMRAVTALEKVEIEVAIMSNLYHRNVVLLFEVINDPRSDKIYLVLEHMAKGPCMVWQAASKLFESPVTRDVLDEDLARSHVLDLLHGVTYLHGQGVCHRDIKPDNLLLNDEGRCHLSDFGCAQKYVQGTLVTDTAGTFEFWAPECCNGAPYDPFKADLWAIGVTFYIFLFGKLPFQAESPKELFERIVEQPLEVPTTEVSPDAIDLLQSLLEKDPSQRMALDMMEYHPWLLALPPEPLTF